MQPSPQFGLGSAAEGHLRHFGKCPSPVRRYYQLNLVSGDHKNPEYRIADDVRVATEAPVDFVTGMTTAVLSAATFIVVLWTIGGALSVELGGMIITIPGFLVIAAVVYAVVASGSMVVIGRRFITVSENKNQAEAEYR
jgi:vitamin B12/bleomycin/antimicrobial peptide transport system ATP-binding/permease protein